jgi:hypothetical protein
LFPRLSPGHKVIEPAPRPAKVTGMNPQRIKVVTRLLLALGLGSALAIFVLAPPEPPRDPFRQDPRAERKYHRDLALYGGKANVLSAELIDGFDALWHGRTLAYTVAALTLAGTWAYRFIATLPAPDAGPADERKGPKP